MMKEVLFSSSASSSPPPAPVQQLSTHIINRLVIKEITYRGDKSCLVTLHADPDAREAGAVVHELGIVVEAYRVVRWVRERGDEVEMLREKGGRKEKVWRGRGVGGERSGRQNVGGRKGRRYRGKVEGREKEARNEVASEGCQR